MHKYPPFSVGLCGIGLLFVLGAIGCAPSTFEDALSRSIEQSRVVDAAARHVGGSPHLRFDALLLSDLDDAIAESDDDAKRKQAAKVYRAAAKLAQRVTHNEILRMSADARQTLAAQTQTPTDAEALCERFDRDADAALTRDLQEIESAPPDSLQRKLRGLRRSVSPLPDDRGRLGRQIALCWAAIPAWIGVQREEAKLRQQGDSADRNALERYSLWRPSDPPGDDLLARFAPTIAVEWPSDRSYPESDDRIGGVRLHESDQGIAVSIDPTEPRVYAYTWQAKVHGQRYRQLVYVWWFPERPAMTANDPAAGHIDGGMLRLTLDSHGRPVIGESSMNCGCRHEVFIAKSLEAAARTEFGEPLPGNEYAAEQDIDRKHDVMIVDTFEVPSADARPVVSVVAGVHEVCRLAFLTPDEDAKLRGVEAHAYQLAPYESLDTLPLGDGIGSMFGPDGLVHHAGRPEGYLLAPTGILSAGQPRKRGTHRVRWDDYVFDDPHLLERTLRLPHGF